MPGDHFALTDEAKNDTQSAKCDGNKFEEAKTYHGKKKVK